jgi:hypothetical protein
MAVVIGGKSDEETKKELKRQKDAEYRRNKRASEKAKKQTVAPITETVLDETQIKLLLISMSSILASRPDMEQWMLSESEVNQIVKPLVNIIAKSESASSLAQHSDAIALVIASLTIIAPRIIITLTKKKTKKEVKKNVTNIKLADDRNKVGKVAESDRTNNVGNADYSQIANDPIFGAVPSVG